MEGAATTGIGTVQAPTGRLYVPAGPVGEVVVDPIKVILVEANVNEPSAADAFIQTSPDQKFWKLRTNFYPETPLYSKTYRIGNAQVQVIFRIQKIKGINTAVAGRIYSGAAEAAKTIHALELWTADLRNAGGIAAAMVAVNAGTGSETFTAINKSMQRIPKKIPVIIKSYNGNEDMLNTYNWNIMRGDMETW